MGGCGTDVSCTSNCSREYFGCTDYCHTVSNTDDIDLLMFEPKRKGGNGKIFNFSWELGSDGKFKNEKSNEIELNVPNSFENRSHMCSFTLKGKRYIIGGYGNEDASEVRRQYLVEGNEVKELEKLQFQFRNGQCLNYDDEHVLLTAAWNQHETWIFNGSSYRQ